MKNKFPSLMFSGKIKTITPFKKQVHNANLQLQRQWMFMPIEKKVVKRILFKDSDKDGVPDKYDCQPRNKYKQENKTIIVESHGKTHLLKGNNGVWGVMTNRSGHDEVYSFKTEIEARKFMEAENIYNQERFKKFMQGRHEKDVVQPNENIENEFEKYKDDDINMFDFEQTHGRSPSTQELQELIFKKKKGLFK